MIIGFVGPRGSGKSASMVLEAYRWYQKGYTVFSNIDLSFEHQPYTAKMIENFASDKNPLSRAVVLIDEAHVLLDSRSSVTKRNKIISYFILQTRKRDVHVLYTTQSFHQIEKRLRDQSDMLISCKFNASSTMVQQTITDTATFKVIKRVIDISPVFKLYDTNAIVDPFGE